MNDTAKPEKFDLSSLDIAAEKRADLLRLFPEARTEGRKIDLERLKAALGEAVDVGRERYGLVWPGKADCFKTIQAPSLGTLRPRPTESVNFDATENVIIGGDNLEVLKLLQKAYLGRVKLIYIDPPYNTGSDFIYPDNYSENLQTYLEYTGQIDATGRKFGTNTETDGRFHSKWLNMMYPRLFLARNLLRDDGLIFISVDDKEVSSLRQMMNEIFGEENFCATFVWNSEGNTDNQYKVKVKHEYIVAYYRDAEFADEAVGRVVDPNTRDDSNLWKGIADNNINKNNPENPPSIVTLPKGFPCAQEALLYPAKVVDDAFFERTREEKFISDEVRREYGIEKLSGLPVKLDEMRVEDGRLAAPCRVYGGFANKNKLLQFIENGCQPILDEGAPLRFYINANAAIRYEKSNEAPRNILSVLSNFGTTEKAKTALARVGISYDYPKPVGLIEYLVKVGCAPLDGIVLDFFAGSGTTAEAVAAVNQVDGGKRTFVLIQLPEPLDEKDQAQRSAAKFLRSIGKPENLTEITKERVRRTVSGLNGPVAVELPLGGNSTTDRGFRAFELASSSFRPWDAVASKTPENLGVQLSLHVSHVLDGRDEADILFEMLLKSGFPLTTPFEKKTLAGKSVFSVGGDVLLICLERKLTLELIRAMAELKPERVVCLDEGFAGNDQLKANAMQTFRTKGVASFRTV